MEKIKVSVIIPFFNSKQYLRDTIQSITSQSLREIELILVDDGSNDGSADTAKEFLKKDKRIIYIREDHRNAGYARNKGIERARGEYLSFLDSDDIFKKDMLKISYERAKEKDLDVLAFRTGRFNEKRKEYEEASWTINKKYIYDNENEGIINRHNTDIFNCFKTGFAFDKLFKRKFIRENNIFFQEQRIINDRYFTYMSLLLAERIGTLDDILMYKRIGNAGSLTDEYLEERNYKYYFESLLKIKDELIKRGLFPEVKKNFISFSEESVLFNIDKFLDTPYFNDLYEDIGNYYGERLLLRDGLLNEIKEKDYAAFRFERSLLRKDDTYLFPFELIEKGERIIIYGAGRVGRSFYRQVRFSGYCETVLFTDKKYKEKFSVVSPVAEIKNTAFDKIVIAIRDFETAKKIREDLKIRLNLSDDLLIWRDPEISF